MNERDAWLYLAQLWTMATEEDAGVASVRWPLWCKCRCVGLCFSIEHLRTVRLIFEETRKMMAGRIPGHGNRFLFPTTLEGAVQRANFCLERAEELS